MNDRSDSRDAPQILGGSDRPPVTKHLLTVVLEDYFHVAPLKSVVQTNQWYRFERRVESNTHQTLDLLDEFGVSATFFVLGTVADEMPQLVREVVNRGHEVASKGFIHRSIRQFGSPSEFRDDLLRSREALERASGTRVYGYRIGHRWFSPEDLWALDVLIEEGFSYDSSVRPLFFRYAADQRRLVPHIHRTEGGQIWEFPLAAWTMAGWSCPISGGNYFRQFPQWMMRRAVRSWINSHSDPFLMYFHVWELDPEQPRIQAAPLRERIRQYRNLDKMIDIIRSYLQWYRFSGVGQHLGLARELVCASSPTRDMLDLQFSRAPVIGSAPVASPVISLRTPVSVVVPCFNEELILPYLANTLRSVEGSLGAEYELSFVFVDDGSSDKTWKYLEELFGKRENCRLVRHVSNRGVAAAIMTGINSAQSEIICSIDCDCTYDPHQLKTLIPMLTDGVDMVTASPYHRQGVVRNVPAWRLFLSKSLSSLYRRVLHHQLATYTSCFRVYRRSAVVGLPIREGGFLGVAEILGRLDLRGGKIVECPAVLEVRLLGRSKMKTAKTILGHLRLLGRLGFDRVFSRDVSRAPHEALNPAQHISHE